MRGEYAYVGIIIPLALVEYLSVIVFTRYFHQKWHGETLTWSTLWEALPFEHTYRSVYDRIGALGLLIFRFAYFLWFLVVACILSYIRNDGNSWFYFTMWNVEILSAYFLMATVASVMGLIFDKSAAGYRRSWHPYIQQFSSVLQAAFSVCGATAFFVTLVSFVLLNPTFEFWNVTVHLMNSVAMITEMLINKIPVHRKYIVINMSWAVLYVYFIIPVKVGGAIHSWPYDFLQLRNPSCIAWYTALFISNLIFFLLWEYANRFVSVYMHSKELNSGCGGQHLNVLTKTPSEDENDEAHMKMVFKTDAGSPVHNTIEEKA